MSKEIEGKPINDYLNDYFDKLPKGWRSELDMRIAMQNCLIEGISYPEKYIKGYQSKLSELERENERLKERLSNQDIVCVSFVGTLNESYYRCDYCGKYEWQH